MPAFMTRRTIGRLLFLLLWLVLFGTLVVITSGALPPYRLTAASLRGLEFKTGDLIFLSV